MAEGVELRALTLGRPTLAVIIPSHVTSLIEDVDNPERTLVLLTGARTVIVEGRLPHIADRLGIAYTPRH